MAAASSSQPSRWWRYRISPSWRRWASTSLIWPSEPPDRIGQARVFQVLEDLLPVANRPGIVQRAEQDRGDEVTLLAITPRPPPRSDPGSDPARRSDPHSSPRQPGPLPAAAAQIAGWGNRAGPAGLRLLPADPRSPALPVGCLRAPQAQTPGFPQRHGMPSCVLAARRSTGAISHQGESGELHRRDLDSTGQAGHGRPAWCVRVRSRSAGSRPARRPCRTPPGR